jgi:HEAT repeat protein
MAMLKDPKEQQWWANIIATLGIIGDERAVDSLTQFLERDMSGEVDTALLGAVLATYRALGHIASKGSDKALDYLIANAKSDAWRGRVVPWRTPTLAGDQLQLVLMKAAIVGLGISAQPRAIQSLKEMQTAGDTPVGNKAAVLDALQLTEEIQAKGRMGVFSQYR